MIPIKSLAARENGFRAAISFNILRGFLEIPILNGMRKKHLQHYDPIIFAFIQKQIVKKTRFSAVTAVCIFSSLHFCWKNKLHSPKYKPKNDIGN